MQYGVISGTCLSFTFLSRPTVVVYLSVLWARSFLVSLFYVFVNNFVGHAKCMGPPLLIDEDVKGTETK